MQPSARRAPRPQAEDALLGRAEGPAPADRRDRLDRLDRLERPARGFSALTRAIVRAAAEAILAEEDERGAVVAARPETCERAVASFDRSAGQSSQGLRRGLGILALLLEWLPLLVIGAPSRMSRLPIARRVRYLEALETSRVGLLAMLLVAFKVPIALPAFEDPEELALIGFDRADTVIRRRLVALKGQP